MRVHVTELNIGDRVQHDTFNSYGLHVLSKGTLLRAQDISKLLLHQVEYVDIEAQDTQSFLNQFDTLSEETYQLIKPYYDQAVEGMEMIFSEAAYTGRVKDQYLQESILPLTEHVKGQKDVVDLLLLLNNKDDYTYQHSIQVGMLSYYCAIWMGYPEEEALVIGKAGYLHDIGKCRIESQILNKPEKLTDHEFTEVAQHTIFGYEIIRNSLYQYSMAIVALQHHERLDGSGYPFRLLENNIHPYAKIVAVADVYSAMITSRAYQVKKDLLTVLQELYRLSFTQLDPTTTHTFISHMLPNFIGKKVLLHTGEIGKIVMTNKTDYFRPLVQVGERFIDLAVERAIGIQEVYM